MSDQTSCEQGHCDITRSCEGLALKLPVYWRKSFLKKIWQPVILEMWERVHGVIIMPLLILKAAALISWNWMTRGLLGSHQGSNSTSSDITSLEFSSWVWICGMSNGISSTSLISWAEYATVKTWKECWSWFKRGLRMKRKTIVIITQVIKCFVVIPIGWIGFLGGGGGGGDGTRGGLVTLSTGSLLSSTVNSLRLSGKSPSSAVTTYSVLCKRK